MIDLRYSRRGKGDIQDDLVMRVSVDSATTARTIAVIILTLGWLSVIAAVLLILRYWRARGPPALDRSRSRTCFTGNSSILTMKAAKRAPPGCAWRQNRFQFTKPLRQCAKRGAFSA